FDSLTHTHSIKEYVMNHDHIPAKQRGLTLWGLLMGGALLAFAALTLMKLFPLYNQSFKVRAAMQAVAGMPEIGQKGVQEIRGLIERNFEVSDVDTITGRDLQKYLKVVANPDGKGRIMTMIYEDRGPLYGDLDVVLKFNESIAIPGMGIE
ncbi:MAG: DUF4845 domain-containing protein, partial [Gammaproteobacteria bacterium]